MDSSRLDKIAIIAITRKGAELGRRLASLFRGSHLYLPQKFAPVPRTDEHAFPPPVKKVVHEAFARYKSLVLIMAVSVAVRSIAAAVRSKREDPAVVVIDDSGAFVVSLISGHLGGANELARKIASFLGAQPVITTASDVNRAIAIDLLGREFGWELEDNSNVTGVSAALVNGEPVGVYQDAGERNWWTKERLPANVRIFTSLEALNGSNCRAALIITDRVLDEEHLTSCGCVVIYRPKSLVIGIGCNRGVACTDIENAVTRVFSEYGLSTKSISKIATIEMKRNEAGLLEFARKYNLPIDYFGKESLSKVNFPSSLSATALRHVGTPSVCEAAAILSSGNISLIVPKVSSKRMVTIAVARLPFDRRERPKSGKLFLVGIGPGDPDHMTFRAREVIRLSEVIVGYKTYIRLVEPFLSQKQVIATGMGGEVQRAKTAISLAKEGKVVCIICSGDAGIYGMTGLVGEILHELGDKLDVEAVPGVPSSVAAAARLGAPLMSDFATISLSDYLISWAEIEQRLKLAAQGNFVIIIHNPKSKKRQRGLIAAREIILQYRPRTTPVGIVSNAYREQQQVVVTDLEHMLDYEIGMNTTLIVGNSDTFVYNGWMVTRRGYQAKYDLGRGTS